MYTHFIEATNGGNHGKFMLARFTAEEAATTSCLPGLEGQSIFFNRGGRRKMTPGRTLVMDLQTGEGAEFSLKGGGLPPAEEAKWALRETHRIWVCPLFEPFLCWLFEQGADQPLGALPRFVELGVPA